MNFQMFKLVLEKVEEPQIKLPTSAGSLNKQESSRKTSIFCFIDYAKAFDCVAHNKLWKILKEMGIPDHLTWEICTQVKKQQLELDMEQQTGSKSAKAYVKAVYCHPAYLTYMQSTHKLESRLPGEISIISHMQMTPPWWQKVKKN